MHECCGRGGTARRDGTIPFDLNECEDSTVQGGSVVEGIHKLNECGVGSMSTTTTRRGDEGS
jgi:hypothetical protein